MIKYNGNAVTINKYESRKMLKPHQYLFWIKPMSFQFVLCKAKIVKQHSLFLVSTSYSVEHLLPMPFLLGLVLKRFPKGVCEFITQHFYDKS